MEEKPTTWTVSDLLDVWCGGVARRISSGAGIVSFPRILSASGITRSWTESLRRRMAGTQGRAKYLFVGDGARIYCDERLRVHLECVI